MMKIVSLLFILLFPTMLFADPVERSISKSLNLWNIKSVKHSGNILKIISKENKITDSTYRAMIGGICMGYLSEPDSLLGITEIQLLNKWEKQGYVFEGGEEECQEYNNLPIKDTKAYILGRTHLF